MKRYVWHLRPGRSLALGGLAAALMALGGTAFPAPTLGAGACPNEQLRSEQPFGLRLPDCRAYEMVSPLEKNDSDAIEPEAPEADGARAAVSGEAVTYKSGSEPFAEPVGAAYRNQYIAVRGASGWTDRSLTLPYENVSTDGTGDYETLQFTPELTAGVGQTNLPLGGARGGEIVNAKDYLYLVDPLSSPLSYTPLNGNTCHEATCGFESAEDTVAGASTDLSHVVYTEETSHGSNVLESVDGEVILVNVSSTGERLADAGAGAGHQKEAEHAVGELAQLGGRSVSADGSRVVFTAPNTFIGTVRAKHVYVRDNIGQPPSPMGPHGECTVPGDACTLEVSASERAEPDPDGAGSARYWNESVDGAKVFFTDCAKLTEDATAVHDAGNVKCLPGNDEGVVGNDLYEYDLEKPEGERLTDLSVDPGEPDGARVRGVPAVSEDGSYVYFVAEGVLASNVRDYENSVHEKMVEAAQSGGDNLYVRHAGVTTFIATLASPQRQDELDAEGGDASDWQSYGAVDTVRISSDGTRLAFLSHRSLTGYDNEPMEPSACPVEYKGAVFVPEPCGEIYLYDAESGTVSCPSCNPSGARPTGSSTFVERETHVGDLEYYTPRNLSESGGRLFFDSNDALVPQDSNGLQDVYEWERPGEGSCTTTSGDYSSVSGGCVFPISNVAGADASFFLDASPSGDDVFIATEDQLVPSDIDGHMDVYDARVGGGFPVSSPPQECDNADSCKPPESPQPTLFGAPASETFSGPGNAVSVSSPAPSTQKGGHGKKVKTGRKRRRRGKHSAAGAQIRKHVKSRHGGKRSKASR